MIDSVRRTRALQKTADKYRGKAFQWGVNDCAKLARTHLINMGHKPPKMPPYKSAIGARTALKKVGFKDLESLFDSLLPRIAPAAMVPGDLALVQGDEHFDCLMICLGRKVMGWAEGADVLVNFTPTQFKAAWRV